MTVALDASAILAVLFEEPGRDRVIELLDTAMVSSVNLAEVVTKLIDSGYSGEQADRSIDAVRPLVQPFDEELALEAGLLREATRRKGLSLGDRACLALARREGATVLTADRAWAGLDVGVAIEIIR